MSFDTLPSFGNRVSASVRGTASVATPSRKQAQTSSMPVRGAPGMSTRSKMMKGFRGNSPAPYLMGLVLAEAMGLVALRHGFRHYHGG